MEKHSLTVPYDYEENNEQKPIVDHVLIRVTQIAEALASGTPELVAEAFSRSLLSGAIEGSY
ncbi:MAG: hypothetical protein ACSLEY_03795 [Candidatus Saccharimonadales bacterium]